MFIVFINQKTAYEMRIGDWSSYVCSSDLEGQDHPGDDAGDDQRQRDGQEHPGRARAERARRVLEPPVHGLDRQADGPDHQRKSHDRRGERRTRPTERSEEHTSELQSLMRISYAVFCLKNKTTAHHKHTKT